LNNCLIACPDALFHVPVEFINGYPVKVGIQITIPDKRIPYKGCFMQNGSMTLSGGQEVDGLLAP
jgi:hypothetical protein